MHRGDTVEVMALCIGIDKYDQCKNHIQWPPLRHCLSDASAMAKAFTCSENCSLAKAATEEQGYQLEDFQQLYDEEGDFCTKVKQHSTTLRAVVVYAACHGVQIQNDVYLVPTDAKVNDRNTKSYKDSIERQCVKVKDIADHVTKVVDESRPKDARKKCVFLFILDTCRNANTQHSTNLDANVTEKFWQSQELENSRCERFFMFSTWQGGCAGDSGFGNDCHSPYTKVPASHALALHAFCIVCLFGSYV